MKFYDKELYQKEQKIKTAIWMLIVFMLGVAVGYSAFKFEKEKYITKLEAEINEKQNTINEQYIELDALGETLYIYELYNKK